ncbi:MAG: helix-turn-helix domain-containing protein [Lewinella sp.]
MLSIENIPDSLVEGSRPNPDLFVYDLKMEQNIFNSKVQLNQHMFSFLQRGRKLVNFPNTSVAVNESQSLLIKSGNCIWSELLDKGDVYYCKLLFFSDRKLSAFLEKTGISQPKTSTPTPCFTIENDAYIHAYLDSLSTIVNGASTLTEKLLAIKFEELLVYLVGKYGRDFEIYLHSLVAREASGFQSIVENSVNSNLNLEDVAFLCHMSLSTFKRSFVREYQISPGKWFRERRLQSAYETLTEGKLTSSDIYLKFGYNNLSNFSAAFKKKFGKYPTEIR